MCQSVHEDSILMESGSNNRQNRLMQLSPKERGENKGKEACPPQSVMGKFTSSNSFPKYSYQTYNTHLSHISQH